MPALSIALLPGDGVGPEVMAEARRAIDALDLDIAWTELDWGADRWHATGHMVSEDWEDVLRRHDAILWARAATRRCPITSPCGS